MPITCAVRGCKSKRTPRVWVNGTLKPHVFTDAECKAAGIKKGKRGVLCADHELKTCVVCGVVNASWLPTTRGSVNPLVLPFSGKCFCSNCKPATTASNRVQRPKAKSQFLRESNTFVVRELIDLKSQADICNVHDSFRIKQQNRQAQGGVHAI